MAPSPPKAPIMDGKVNLFITILHGDDTLTRPSTHTSAAAANSEYLRVVRGWVNNSYYMGNWLLQSDGSWIIGSFELEGMNKIPFTIKGQLKTIETPAS